MKIVFMFSGEKVQRFIEHLINSTNFCISCGDLCDDCRLTYGRYSSDIIGIYEIPTDLPDFIDDPSEYLPDDLPLADILIALAIHPDILAELPSLLDKNGIKGLIVPVENGDWVPLGLQKQIEEELRGRGIQYAFPRPYCALRKGEFPLINEFIDYFKMGYPRFEFVISKNKIVDGKVLYTSPCGCAFYVNRELIRYQRPIDKELKEVISKAHHSYPCNADMNHDIVIGDAPLHVAGYIHREAVYKAIVKATEPNHPRFIEEELEELKSHTEFNIEKDGIRKGH